MSLESAQNARTRQFHVEINDAQFAIRTFQHVGINGASIPLSVQKFPNLSHYVRKPLLGQRLIPVVDVGAGDEDFSYEIVSGLADGGPIGVLVY